MSTAAGFPRLHFAVLGVLLAVAGCDAGRSSQPNFADLVEEVSPSVVNISTVADEDAPTQGDDDGQSSPPLGDDSPEWLKRFLEKHPDQAPGDNNAPDDDLRTPDAQDQGPTAPQSLGSGLVLWEDGYILTNYHVIQDSSEVVVRLLDRRQMIAKVIGFDERSDLALLKIAATDLPAVKLGDSDKLRPGEWVLAIGSPFGFDYSVTAGIVSAKGRNLISEQYVPFVQTDVAINPGNSGGPLFNLDGEVIGVNSQIYSQSGGYQGVSFAIPIDVAAKVARQLKAHGRVTRGWLGVVVQEVNRELAQRFGMERPIGALITRVVPGSPADQAGLRAGDVILSYDGRELQTSQALPPEVGNSDPGQMVSLLVQRDGRAVPFKVQVGQLENQDVELVPDNDGGGQAEAPLGILVAGMTDEQRRKAGVFTGGVLVVDVRPGAGAEAGLRAGDVLMSVAGQNVDSADRFAQIVSTLTPGVSVQLLISRNGNALFVPLDVPATTRD